MWTDLMDSSSWWAETCRHGTVGAGDGLRGVLDLARCHRTHVGTCNGSEEEIWSVGCVSHDVRKGRGVSALTIVASVEVLGEVVLPILGTHVLKSCETFLCGVERKLIEKAENGEQELGHHIHSCCLDALAYAFRCTETSASHDKPKLIRCNCSPFGHQRRESLP